MVMMRMAKVWAEEGDGDEEDGDGDGKDIV